MTELKRYVHAQNIETIKRTETLDAKEKALQAKEAELRRWEADLRATGGLKPKKNWPWLCPIVHHDIFAEVKQKSWQVNCTIATPDSGNMKAVLCCLECLSGLRTCVQSFRQRVKTHTMLNAVLLFVLAVQFKAALHLHSGLPHDVVLPIAQASRISYFCRLIASYHASARST